MDQNHSERHSNLLDTKPEIKKEHILKFTNNGFENISKDVQKTCKLVTYSSEHEFDDIMLSISRLNKKLFSKLFCFAIATKNFGFSKEDQRETARKVYELKTKLLSFDSKRPLILQLTSEDESVTRFYYKEESSVQFLSINLKQEKLKENKNFSSFLCSFLHYKFVNFEEELLEFLPKVNNSSLILRFLKMLNLSDDFFIQMIFQVTESGTAADFQAVLDTPFEKSDFCSDLLSAVCTDDPNGEDYSFLSTSISHKNLEIIDFLISKCTKCIQNLPFDHQVQISTLAYKSNQHKILCNLIEIADFPFPSKFHKVRRIEDENLRTIALQRKKLFRIVLQQNKRKIKKFIGMHKNLKFAYGIKNITAVHKAAQSKKFVSLFLLKSYGYKQTEEDLLVNVVPKKSSSKEIKQKNLQRKENVEESLTDKQNSVNLICTKALIYDKKNIMDDEKNYRKIIRNCFELIFEKSPELINIASQCEKLKIIFDFESETVENSSLSNPESSGSTYQKSRWIFVGAKLSEKRTCKVIASVVAHELCHYVMGLAYENNENPFYKHTKEIASAYDAIVKSIDQWSAKDSPNPDDECNGIISSVFRQYNIDEFNQELIVRVLQIIVYYDGENEKLDSLFIKYQNLFEFWNQRIIPDLQIINLKTREQIRKTNEACEVIKTIKNKKINLKVKKYKNTLIKDNITIIKSNVPMLLLYDIYNHLYEQQEDSIEYQNIFVDSKKLTSKEKVDDLLNLLSDKQNTHLNVFIDCSKDDPQYLKINNQIKLIFIVSNDTQAAKLYEIFNFTKNSSSFLSINYFWEDIEPKDQNALLQKQITFQNKPNILLDKILNGKANPANHSEQVKNFPSDIIDDQFLNLLVNDSEILINSIIQNDLKEMEFKILYKKRDFIKNDNELYKPELSKQNAKMKEDGETQLFKMFSRVFKESYLKLTEEEFIADIKDRRYILITDKAGNGKSWAMKNLIQIQDSTKWTAYIDLKQHIKDFEGAAPHFLTFMIQKILKLDESNFESKLFEFLYSTGRVFVIFDAYDEISPNFTDIVTNLISTFEFNGGNQMCITTRDYLSSELMTKLKINTSYNLGEFTQEDGISLVELSLILMDKQDGNSNGSIEEFINHSLELKIYKKKAERIVETIIVSKTRSVGMPQLYSMAADIFKKNTNTNINKNLTRFDIYDKFIDNLYEIWSSEKGNIRKDDNKSIQKNQLNFFTLHQFLAIESFFKKLAKKLFHEFELEKQMLSKIIACGLITLIDEKYIFIHETFREFFVAHYIVKSLSSKKINVNVLELFIEILISKQFEIIRMFLNDALDEIAVNRIAAKSEMFCEKIKKIESLSEIFANNLNLLGDLILKIFQCMKKSEIETILTENAKSLFKNLNDTKMFFKFVEFLLKFYKIEDLKSFILKHKIFLMIIKSNLDIRSFEKCISIIEIHAGKDFIKTALKSVSKEDENRKNRNILYYLCNSKGLSPEKVKKLFNIIDSYVNFNELQELIFKCDYLERNILQISFQTGNEENFQIIWNGLEDFIDSTTFLKVVKNKDLNYENILHYAARCNSVHMYNLLWKLLLKVTKDNKQALIQIIFGKETNERNFLHTLVGEHNNLQQFVKTINILKNILTKRELNELLMSEGYCEMTLIQSAVWQSKSPKKFSFSFDLLRRLFSSDDEFWKFLMKTDDSGKNVLSTIVSYSSKEVFDYFLKKLKEIDSKGCKVKEMLTQEDQYGNNILQNAVEHNDSLELIESLWETFENYFSNSEIVLIIKHFDRTQDNLLTSALGCSTLNIVEFTWDKICKLMSINQQREFLMTMDSAYLIRRSVVKENREWVINLLDEYDIKANSYSCEDIFKRLFVIIIILLIFSKTFGINNY